MAASVQVAAPKYVCACINTVLCWQIQDQSARLQRQFCFPPVVAMVVHVLAKYSALGLQAFFALATFLWCSRWTSVF